MNTDSDPSPPARADGFGAWNQQAILVVDDEPGMRSFLTRALSARCAVVAAAENTAAANALLAERHFDLIILDNSMPGKSGVEWLAELRAAGWYNDAILITAFADLEIAIAALRAGAADFILKPFRINQILNAIGRSFDRARLRRENFVLRRALMSRGASEAGGGTLVGESAAVRQLRAVVQRLAPLPTTVLITGESGTGKEVAARALHDLSPRAGNPFVPVNCAAIAPEIIESELFGHLKGAFTGAASSREGLFFYAQGGTLFLDEIGEMPLPMQAKLLRVLEDKKIRRVGAEREVPVEVRVIAATNRDLAEEVAAGRFRQDLYYRLNVMQIALPPLRDRKEDVAPLARHFMVQISASLGVPPLPLDAAIVEHLEDNPWPGNARELRNVIEHALIVGGFGLPSPAGGVPASAGADGDDASLEAAEKRHILRVLAASGGNKSEAARRLGISRKTLERKCAEWRG